MATLPQTDKTFYLNPSVPSSGDGRTLATPFRGFADYKSYAATTSLTGSVTLIMLNDRDLGTLDFDDLVGHEEELHFFAPFASASDVTMELTGTNANRRMTLTIRDINGNRMAATPTGVHMSHNCTINVLGSFDGQIDNLVRQTGERELAQMAVNIFQFNDGVIELLPTDTTVGLGNAWELDIKTTDTSQATVISSYDLLVDQIFKRTLQTMRFPTLLPPIPPQVLPTPTVRSVLRGNFLSRPLPQFISFFRDFHADNLGLTNPALTFFPRALSASSLADIPRTTYVSLLFADGIVNIVSLFDLVMIRLNQDTAETTRVTLPVNQISFFQQTASVLMWTFVMTDAIVNALFATNNNSVVTNTPISLQASINVHNNPVLGTPYAFTQVELYRTYVYNVGA